MIKSIEWSTNWESNEQMKGKYLVFFNKFAISKGQWNGIMFNLEGLGLSKAERFLKLKQDLI